jgi:hypothetical protein
MADTLTADQVHAQVHELRAQAERQPFKIELGKRQREAIEADVRAAAGTNDIGPLTQFQGLDIVKSRKDDHVRLLAADESGDDVEVESVQPVTPSGPDAPEVDEEHGG